MCKKTKYAGLGPLAKSNGLTYITALQRVRRGWSMERAGTVPAGQSNPDFVKKKSGPKGPRGHHHVGPRPISMEVFASLYDGYSTKALPVYEQPGFVAKPYTPPVDRKMPWERPGWVRAPKKSSYKPSGKHRGKEIEDTSPPHIQALRATYCAEFIKTGILDQEMSAKLKEYADEVHRAARTAARISAEQKADSLRRGQAPLRDDNSRDGDQPDVHA